MYHYQNQSSLVEAPSSSTAGSSNELFSLFDRLSDTYPTSFSSSDKIKQQQTSAPASADVSPYMSEKECMEQPENEDPESPSNFNSKSRRASLNKAERRAEHNAIERARRECLNSKFQQLAEALPNLQNHRRPSKGQIVEKALDWVKQNISKEDRYQYQIMQLQNENKRLMAQINIAHEQSTDSGVVTPPIHTNSPSSAPFPTSNFHHQQFPATSTPSSSNVNTIQKRSNNGDVKMNHYCSQPEEINMMYSMVPLGVEWQNQTTFVNQNNFECLMPSASSSSSSRLLRDDDNDSSSSADEVQKQNIQMAFQDMSQCSFFEVNNQQEPNAPWCKIQQQQNTSYPINYVPVNASLNYAHNHSYLS